MYVDSNNSNNTNTFVSNLCTYFKSSNKSKSKRKSKSLSYHNFRDFAKVCFFIGIFSEPDLRVRILLILFLFFWFKQCLSLVVIVFLTCYLMILNKAIISDFRPEFKVFSDVINIYTLLVIYMTQGMHRVHV